MDLVGLGGLGAFGFAVLGFGGLRVREVFGGGGLWGFGLWGFSV